MKELGVMNETSNDSAIERRPPRLYCSGCGGGGVQFYISKGPRKVWHPYLEKTGGMYRYKYKPVTWAELNEAQRESGKYRRCPCTEVKENRIKEDQA